MVDFGTKVLGTQNATLKHLSNFKEDISDSRTFSFLHELEMLLENGLIKGGDLNNAIVYVDKPISAGVRFLFQGKPKHMIAIIKAHGSFYKTLPKLLKFRQQQTSRISHKLIASIVWSYFVRHITKFNKL